jgi:DNA repair exonuclease SbcCD nuclease subunit
LQARITTVAEKPSVTLPGKVEKIIPGLHSAIPEKAQISVEGAEHLYKEIRVENKLQDDNGKPIALKPGAEVEVTIEAEKTATTPKEHESGGGKNAPDK